jgi:hypothetical protein
VLSADESEVIAFAVATPATAPAKAVAFIVSSASSVCVDTATAALAGCVPS